MAIFIVSRSIAAIGPPGLIRVGLIAAAGLAGWLARPSLQAGWPPFAAQRRPGRRRG